MRVKVTNPLWLFCFLVLQNMSQRRTARKVCGKVNLEEMDAIIHVSMLDIISNMSGVVGTRLHSSLDEIPNEAQFRYEQDEKFLQHQARLTPAQRQLGWRHGFGHGVAGGHDAMWLPSNGRNHVRTTYGPVNVALADILAFQGSCAGAAIKVAYLLQSRTFLCAGSILPVRDAEREILA